MSQYVKHGASAPAKASTASNRTLQVIIKIN